MLSGVGERHLSLVRKAFDNAVFADFGLLAVIHHLLFSRWDGSNFDGRNGVRLVCFRIDVVSALGDIDGTVLLLDTVDAVFDLKTVRDLCKLLVGELQNSWVVDRESTCHDEPQNTANIIPYNWQYFK